MMAEGGLARREELAELFSGLTRGLCFAFRPSKALGIWRFVHGTPFIIKGDE